MTKRIMVTKFKYVAKAVEKYRTSRNFHISAAGKRVGQIVYHVGSNIGASDYTQLQRRYWLGLDYL